jgi:hypothetical protein
MGKEYIMAEETAQAAQEAQPAQHQAVAPKVWEDAQVKEIIVSRDEAKKAKRALEADLEAARSENETLRKAQAQFKADFEAERKRAEQYDAEQKKLREHLTARITDESLKDIAAKEPLSLEALMKLSERQPTAPSSDRKQTVSQDFESELQARPGETPQAYMERVRGLRRSKQ